LADDLYAFAEQELVDLCPEMSAWARASRYCNRLCDGEDYAHEGAVRLLSRLTTVVGGLAKCASRNAGRSYLRVCFKREILSVVRKEASREHRCEHMTGDALDAVADPAAAAEGQPLADTVTLETQGRVNQALTELSDLERSIIARTDEGVLDATLAAELELTEVGVRTHRMRARRKLATRLGLDGQV
jgi:RNA polymerase sigma factor (sigma-70 family)